MLGHSGTVRSLAGTIGGIDAVQTFLSASGAYGANPVTAMLPLTTFHARVDWSVASLRRAFWSHLLSHFVLRLARGRLWETDR